MYEDSTIPEWLTVPEAVAFFDCPRVVLYAAVRCGVLDRIPPTTAKRMGDHFNVRFYLSRDQVRQLLQNRRPAVRTGQWLDKTAAAAYLCIGVGALNKRLTVGDLRSVSWLTIPPEQRTRQRRASRTYLSVADLDALRSTLYPQRALQIPTHHLVADLAYAAGFVDGEGCIRLSRRSDKYHFHHSLIVSVANTNEAIMLWFASTFGGNTLLHRHDRPEWADRWDWKLCASGAYQFLRLIRPFLRVKARQADLGIEFFEHVLAYQEKRVPVSASEQEWRDDHGRQLNSLNGRRSVAAKQERD